MEYEWLSNPDYSADPKENRAFWFLQLARETGNCVAIDDFPSADHASDISVMACSRKYGYFVVGTKSGFIFGETHLLIKQLSSVLQPRVLVKNVTFVPVKQGVKHDVCISADEIQIIVVAGGRDILVYNVKDIIMPQYYLTPAVSIALNCCVDEIRVSPDPNACLAAVRTVDGKCLIIDWKNAMVKATLPDTDITAICWSPSGEEIACGKTSGAIHWYCCRDLLSNARLPSPPRYKDDVSSVKQLVWIEDHTFFVVYEDTKGKTVEKSVYRNRAFIVQEGMDTVSGSKTNPNEKNDTQGSHYILLSEITRGATHSRPSNRFYVEKLPLVGADFKHLLIVANAASSEISVVSQDTNGDWATLSFQDVPGIHLPPKNSQEESYPVGLGIGLTTVPMSFDVEYDSSYSDANPPKPILFVVSNHGCIYGYHCCTKTPSDPRNPNSLVFSRWTPSLLTIPSPVAAPPSYKNGPFDEALRLSAVLGLSSGSIPSAASTPSFQCLTTDPSARNPVALPNNMPTFGKPSFSYTGIQPTVTHPTTQPPPAQAPTTIADKLAGHAIHGKFVKVPAIKGVEGSKSDNSELIRDKGESVHMSVQQSLEDIIQRLNIHTNELNSLQGKLNQGRKTTASNESDEGDKDTRLDKNRDNAKTQPEPGSPVNDSDTTQASTITVTETPSVTPFSPTAQDVQSETAAEGTSVVTQPLCKDSVSVIKEYTHSSLKRLENETEATCKQYNPTEQANASWPEQAHRSPWTKSLDVAIAQLEDEIRKKQDELYYLLGELAEMKDVRNRTREYCGSPNREDPGYIIIDHTSLSTYGHLHTQVTEEIGHGHSVSNGCNVIE